ncbi:MAG: imidazole glycerol phosphate synthase subunit HisF [Candidatus Wildermuthbacteria bacterium]|nr:imidazole glycerol phosphate synthase subunit HisF [Candidatus Wildermuthbacteria bacterium]
MVKIRIIPVLLLKNGRMVKPIRFGGGGERDVGWPITTARIYDSQDPDEIIFLDITATEGSRRFLFDTLEEVAKNSFLPLTAGGGVRTIGDIYELLQVGADKISINTAAVESPHLIEEGAKKFGSQCIVVSIDVREAKPGFYKVYTHGGKTETGLEAVEWARRVANLGAGEILLTSVDREGTMRGYDTKLIRMVADAVPIPVIAHGGAGTRQHFVDAIVEGHASAAAAASVFHFSDSNLTQVKSYLLNTGISVRPI